MSLLNSSLLLNLVEHTVANPTGKQLTLQCIDSGRAVIS